MKISRLATAASVIPLTTLILSACVSQSDYDKLQAQNQQLQAQNAGLQREARFVEAGDLLFPEGGYQLSPAGRAELSSNIVPKLTGCRTPRSSFTAIPTICRSGRNCSGPGSTTI